MKHRKPTKAMDQDHKPTDSEQVGNSTSSGSSYSKIYLTMKAMLSKLDTNSKRLAAGLLVLLALVLLIVALTPSKTTPPTTTSPAALAKASSSVSINSSGFTPAILTVLPGTQVTWTNTDTNPHQVAADPYPKNNSIPGFDSTQVLVTKDSYSFKFTKAGSYTYHDQLHPFDLKGTVVVR